MKDVQKAGSSFSEFFYIENPNTRKPFTTITGGPLDPVGGGEQIPAIRMTRGLGQGGPKKQTILIAGGIHAREWVAPDFCVRLMQYIALDARNPAIDPPLEEFEVFDKSNKWTIPKLLDHAEIVIVPVVNPSGYDFSRSTRADQEFRFVTGVTETGDPIYNPDAVPLTFYPRRLWRKNRRDFRAQGAIIEGGKVVVGKGDGTTVATGVDLNRNFPEQWDSAATEARQKVPMEFQTFRGTEPASEIETQAIIALHTKFQFDGMIFYHSYGGAYLHPLSYTSKTIDEEFGQGTKKITSKVGDQRQITDLNLLRDLADRMAKKSKTEPRYVIGQPSKIPKFGASSGNAGDWAYLRANAIYYNIELNPGDAKRVHETSALINRLQPKTPNDTFEDQRLPALYFCFVIADKGFKSKPRWVDEAGRKNP